MRIWPLLKNAACYPTRATQKQQLMMRSSRRKDEGDKKRKNGPPRVHPRHCPFFLCWRIWRAA